MFPLSFQIREAFHLLVLRFLAESFSTRPYALKGGICLRFFHLSPRLSEDLDIDVAGISVSTFRTRVRKILNHRALQETLRMKGVATLNVSEPKQTETTQRWKVHLTLAGGGSLATRLEASRRQKELSGVVRGVPSAEILRSHQMIPFVCRYYGAEEMVCQKIRALAAASRAACRDLFDLHHLLTHAGVSEDQVLLKLTSATRHQALQKVGAFERKDFQEQVAPFLPEEMARLLGGTSGFEEMKGRVRAFLEKP